MSPLKDPGSLVDRTSNILCLPFNFFFSFSPSRCQIALVAYAKVHISGSQWRYVGMVWECLYPYDFLKPMAWHGMDVPEI